MFAMRNKKFIWLAIAVVVLIVIAAVIYFFSYSFKNENNYQAVFLSNGQVYFGKLSKENSQYPVLRDIYYLQVNQSPQPITSTNSSNINIVKLGAELHGPEDEMRINRSQILFIEDLRPDSKVLEAIRQFKK